MKITLEDIYKDMNGVIFYIEDERIIVGTKRWHQVKETLVNIKD